MFPRELVRKLWRPRVERQQQWNFLLRSESECEPAEERGVSASSRSLSSAELREALERYNEEDCRSTASLRKWLEEERQKLVDAGAAIARPELGDGALASSRKQSQLVGRVSVTRFG